MKTENGIAVNGIRIYPFQSFGELIDYIEHKPSILFALNAGKLGRTTPEMKAVINKNVGYCDGWAAVVALQQKGTNCPVIPGCELWLKIIERFVQRRTFYLVGGKQEVVTMVVNKLHIEFPQIKIVGYRNGYITSKEERKMLINDIYAKKPDIVFVAMGSPAQEILMIEMQRVNPHAIYQGLGGSFDVYIGKVKRSPLWTRKLHIEGLYRAMTRIKDKNIRKRLFLDLLFYMKLKLRLIK